MRVVLCIEYKGTNYTGWQAQNNKSKKTIQYFVDNAISKVADHKIKSICAGRTDTGVHAHRQFIHFDTDKKRDKKNWIMGINSHLPEDIKVNKLFFVDSEFHARYTAISRSYRYIILNQEQPSSLLFDFVLWERTKINVSKIRQSIKYLRGENDFSCFRSAGCQAKNPIKKVQKITIKIKENFIIIDITANAFLYHMVRNIVGTLLEVGLGKYDPSYVGKLIKNKDRQKAGKKVSSKGLYLMNIEYPKKYKILNTDNSFLYNI
ncbi:MAG: tRNA pseudouridine(38-40) synthase TruA [Pseudomonadota bacterium]|nr:tRNA pseudouridine(38-40) synthase TruA [Pseudomonadota bacterium]